MGAYCKEIKKLEGKFYIIEYTHVVRDKNKATNELSKLGSSRAKIPHGVFVLDLVPVNQGSKRSRGRKAPRPATSGHGSSPDHYGTFPDHSYFAFDH
jgi:hypothetical protein